MSLITVVIMTIYVLAIVFLFVTLLLRHGDVNQMHIVMCILNLLYCLSSEVILLCDYYNMKRAWFLPSVLEEPC